MQQELKRKSFEELLLEIIKSNRKHEPVTKNKLIVPNYEIITTKEYVTMKENEDKVKKKALAKKERKLNEREQKTSQRDS